LTNGCSDFKHIRIKRYSLPSEQARRNQKTPERMTIEKPLYFCSRQFMGHFARVMNVAVSNSGAVARACLVQHPPSHATAQQEVSLSKYRPGRSTGQS
jgi:hypothetical protein